jgi:hypothetical protein
MALTSDCSRAFFGPHRYLDTVFFCTDPDPTFFFGGFPDLKKIINFFSVSSFLLTTYVGTFTAVFIFKKGII